MLQNVARKVKHYRLAKNRAYISIFEAVSNSIDSYKDNSQVKITIELYRDSTGLDFGSDEIGKEIKPYKEIRIIDSGEGFTNENFQSFNISDSDYKEKVGGKGLGRFSWLKAFEKVKIESCYFYDEKYYERKFDFERTISGIANESVSEIETKRTGTVVHLLNQKKGWEIPKRATTICEKLIEHFLPYFLVEPKPQIIIVDKDDGSEINVIEFFVDNYKGEIGTKEIEIEGQKLLLSVHKSKIGSMNQLIYIANKRASKHINLAKYIIDLNSDILEEGGTFYIIAFISGELLDKAVSPERDDFAFDDDEIQIDFAKINTRCAVEIEDLIQPILAKIFEEKRKKVEDFICKEGPEYRYLVSKNPEVLKSISPVSNKNEIEECLHHAEVVYKEKTRKEITRVLAESNISEDEIDKIYEQVSEAAKADLTKYILWRNHVIELLDKKIKWNDEREYKKEDELHKLFYQMKKTSEQVPYETNNLWLIDERLNFHDFLASDIAIDRKNGIRPDIIAYNIPYYFNNEDSPEDSFSIVEFKRPMRDDYDDDYNPVDQISDYVEKIRDGKAIDNYGQSITVNSTTPCFAYIICDITPKIRSICRKRDFTRMYDNLGFFKFNNELNIYFEVSSFKKIAKEAKNRNRIFMKKIGLK